MATMMTIVLNQFIFMTMLKIMTTVFHWILLEPWSYHLGARIQGPAQAQLLQIEK